MHQTIMRTAPEPPRRLAVVPSLANEGTTASIRRVSGEYPASVAPESVRLTQSGTLIAVQIQDISPLGFRPHSSWLPVRMAYHWWRR
jgi:hypothetical protein